MENVNSDSVRHREELLSKLREKANLLPPTPGVYLMQNSRGVIIYVGKSKVLKHRVSQYFQSHSELSPKTAKMVSSVSDFSYILCDSEMEALTLENSLIKLHSPKYNIRLKDDKNYPYIRVSVNDPYPTVTMVRKRAGDGAKYFGPYSSGQAVSRILATIRKTFSLPSCSRQFPRDIGKGRPCVYAQLGQCCAPCSGQISSEEYRERFRDICAMLRGDYIEAEEELTRKMQEASDSLSFEAAAVYRDRIQSLSFLRQKQKVVADPDTDQDIIGIYRSEMCTVLSVLYVRSGALIDSENLEFGADQIAEDEDLTSFLSAFYGKRESVPREILIGFPFRVEESVSLSAFLSSLSNRKTIVRVPQRGDSRKLCEMANENAAQHGRQLQQTAEKNLGTAVTLAELLALDSVPERIEAYDISNLGSEHITAGMIVWDSGRFCKKDYRLFSIRGAGDSPDDYGSMREALRRRLERLMANEPGFEQPPDLILLDGGKAHVHAAEAVMEELGLSLPVFGMVKDAYHKTRALTDSDREISIASQQSVYNFIFRIQEEVHRFTLSRMMNAKRKTVRTSSLEKIKGIGPAKARLLLETFGSMDSLAGASEEQLLSVKGIQKELAQAIMDYFKEKSTR
ncbi:MAG: excinuclease ABC subunit UvrC [Clostridia bacterium]|nr:excinuclease ABC subunit UvrC [Clostridia bacterium]